MKKILATYAVTANGIRGLLEKNNRFIAAASIICFAFGLVLSHLIELGVRVQKVTLAEETPALEFLCNQLNNVGYRQLGGSGFKVPMLTLGTGTIGGKGELFSACGSSGVPEAKLIIVKYPKHSPAAKIGSSEGGTVSKLTGVRRRT